MTDVGLGIGVFLGIPALLWALVKLYCVRAEKQLVFPPHVDSPAQARVVNARRHERDPDTEVLPSLELPTQSWNPQDGWQRVTEC